MLGICSLGIPRSWVAVKWRCSDTWEGDMTAFVSPCSQSTALARYLLGCDVSKDALASLWYAFVNLLFTPTAYR